MAKALALFDYSASDISVIKGETLTIVQNDGTDWCIVKNANNIEGAVPTSYIEILKEETPPAGEEPSISINYEQDDAIQNFDKEFDEDGFITNDDQISLPLSPSQTALSLKSRRTFFTKKSELEYYLTDPNLPSIYDFEIILSNNILQNWKSKSNQYQVYILGRSLTKKFGIRNYVNYQLRIENNEETVNRHYKQFKWLHSQFEYKYPNICIPPLPEKPFLLSCQSEETLDQLQLKLDLWLNAVSSHPILRESELFYNFLRLQNEKEWKESKRKAEQDLFAGVQWFCTIKTPSILQETTSLMYERIGNFLKAAICLDNIIKAVNVSFDKMILYHSHYYKNELFILGGKLDNLSSIVGLEALNAPFNNEVCMSVKLLGQTFTDISNMYAEQSKDVKEVMNKMEFLRKVVQQMPSLVLFEKNALNLYEQMKVKPERLKGRKIEEVTPRREKISHITIAEINHFNKEKTEDMLIYLTTFVDKQVEFYSKLTENFKECQRVFRNIPMGKKSHF